MCAGRPYVALAPFVWLLPNPLGEYSLAANLKVSYLWKMTYKWVPSLFPLYC